MVDYAANVVDYGADPTGGSDSWAAIMAAFNNGRCTAVATSSSSGSTITFAIGTVPAQLVANTQNYYAINATTSPTTSVAVHSADPTTGLVVLNGTMSVTSGNTIQFDQHHRGTIYFPPGNYLVSQPIDYLVTASVNVDSSWLGEMGRSTITGNFADYVLKRQLSNTGRAGLFFIEKLTIVNTNAAGGGIRLGFAEGDSIRDCTIIANLGINTTSIDALISDAGGPGFYWGSLEVVIENCTLSPYTANASGSVGLIIPSNGPIINCRVTGFETGCLLFGGEGSMAVLGCYFEGNGTAILPGQGPGNLGAGGTNNVSISGCWFKNNGTAFHPVALSNSVIQGCYIEGTNGAAPGGTNPQYGILIGACGQTIFRGITVTGQYAQAGISIPDSGVAAANLIFKGVQIFNSGAGVPWQMPTNALSARFINCNVAPVFTVPNLGAYLIPISTARWDANGISALGTVTKGSGGTDNFYFSVPLTGGSGSGAQVTAQVVSGQVDNVTITAVGSGYTAGNTLSAASGNIGGVTGFSVPVSSVANLVTLTAAYGPAGSFNNVVTGGGWQIKVAGITPSGYNGVFSATPDGAFNVVTYPLASNPGSFNSGASTGATVYAMSFGDIPSGATPAIWEGSRFSVSDSETATQGGIAITGGGSTHALVRWNGVNFTVIGK